MSIKYSITKLKNQFNKEEPPKFYAKAQVREIVDLERIASEIAYATSLTEGDVFNVIRSIPYCIVTHLADGDLVDMKELGRFQFQLKSEGACTREEFTQSNIKKAKLQFRPGKLFNNILNELQYEEVIPVSKKKEVKRRMKKGEF